MKPTAMMGSNCGIVSVPWNDCVVTRWVAEPGAVPGIADDHVEGVVWVAVAVEQVDAAAIGRQRRLQLVTRAVGDKRHRAGWAAGLRVGCM